MEGRGRAVQRSAREIPGAGRRMDEGPDKHRLSVLGAMVIVSVVLRKEVEPSNRLGPAAPGERSGRTAPRRSRVRAAHRSLPA
jgi:hypothetical protein